MTGAKRFPQIFTGSTEERGLRLSLDCWAVVYLNGRQVAVLYQAEEFDTAGIPVTLNPGTNHLLIKTNNRQNRERHLRAIHSAVE